MVTSSFAGKSALVTGASAGLGEEFAHQLAERGVTRLTLVARRADRLDDLRARLTAAHPSLRVETDPADLGHEEAVTELLRGWTAAGYEPDILINNAGFGDLGPLENSEPAKIEQMLAVNITALTRLTQWAVPLMLHRRSGWICNVGSTAGMLPLPSFAVYGGTKAYVNSFTEALRAELHGSGVRVMALCPGPVETEFGQVASRPNGKRAFAPPPFLCVPKDRVVRETLDALARGQGRLVPGLLVRLGILAAESCPRWILRGFFNLGSGSFRRERAERAP
jgi:short-subunit dehydrogenase